MVPPTTACTQQISVRQVCAVIDCSKGNQITAGITGNSCRIASEYHCTHSEGQLRQGHCRAPPFCHPLLVSATPLFGSSLMVLAMPTTCSPKYQVEDKSAPVMDCSKQFIQSLPKLLTMLAVLPESHCTYSEGRCDKGHHGHPPIFIYLFGLGDTTITWKFT